MLAIDRWAMARTAQLIQRCLKGYEEYQFHQVYNALYNFCTVDLSSFYLDILKDRLYTFETHSPERRSAQTALWRILDAFTRLIAPILPFTAEEVYAAMHEGMSSEKRALSVHTLLFPEYQGVPDQEEFLAEWDKLVQVRQVVSKALEEVRQTGAIGNSLEAKVIIKAAPEQAALLRRHAAELRYIFIVSRAEVMEERGVEADLLQVQVTLADGRKCERCWNYSEQVGANAVFPTLCERCTPVVTRLLG